MIEKEQDMDEKKTFVCTLEPFEDDNNEDMRIRTMCGVSNTRLNEITNELMKVCDGHDSYYLRDVVIDWLSESRITFNEVMAFTIASINSTIYEKMMKAVKQAFKDLLKGEDDED
jgi:hypothetical protein